VIVLVAVLGGVAGTALGVARQPAGAIYTAAQVVAGLKHDPAHWAGRTVTVRGTLAVAEGLDWQSGVTSGMWWASWPGAGTKVSLPTGVPLHIILVAHGLYRLAVSGPAPGLLPAPPMLVVLVRPHRVQPAWPLLSWIVQHLATNLPSRSWLTVIHLPLVGPVFERLLMPGLVHGGAPRLYRVRLLPPVPAGRRASCPLVCDDAVLLDNLS
jgi:hypothetical protein